MKHPLDAYRPFAGDQAVDELLSLGQRLQGRTVCHVNATASGGGVAEILTHMVPLLKELGLPTRWEVMRGGEGFFAVTKAMHNALHGQPTDFTRSMRETYMLTTQHNLDWLTIDDEFVLIHDLQPAALVTSSKTSQQWIWRCHIDLSSPQEEVWDFLHHYVSQYDAAIFSVPAFAKPLPVPRFFIPPAIDPLSDKNRDLTEAELLSLVSSFPIDWKRPVITQVSRFDRLKNPVGLIRTFLEIRRSEDCQLVMAGGGSVDDPEGQRVFKEALDIADNHPDIHVLSLPPTAHLEINALQRASTIIVQNSIKEGFGLTVAEGLWKAKPVVAMAVGGIPIQIPSRDNGLLAHSPQEMQDAIIWLLRHPEERERMGRRGKEHVREHFLLTRHLRDYLTTFLVLDGVGPEDLGTSPIYQETT